jgi:hypothetical protein
VGPIPNTTSFAQLKTTTFSDRVRARKKPKGDLMASQKQRAAARRNIKQAADDAKRKQTVKHLPKKRDAPLGSKPQKPNDPVGKAEKTFIRLVTRAIHSIVI